MYINPPIIIKIILIKIFYHMLKVDFFHKDIDEQTFISNKWWLLRKLVNYKQKY